MEPVMHLCCDDCWTGEIDDAEPRAIRWATRDLAREMSPAWGKFHYTEGNGLFTACGVPVVLFEVDGSPQEKELGRQGIACNRCNTVLGLCEDNDKLLSTLARYLRKCHG